MSDSLSDSLREGFRGSGYVAMEAFLSAEEVAEVELHLARYIDEVIPVMPREELFYEDLSDRSTLKQIQRMFAYDEYFRSLMFGSRFEKLASLLLGTPVEGVNLQYFNKPPGIGQPTPPHQDGYYFMLEPNEAVTMWLALDVVDEGNGCVRYVPGSHLQGLREHSRTQTLGFSQGLSDWGSEEDLRAEVALPAQPGDLLAHHALTIHRADGNQSTDRHRRALGLIYFSASARESPEKAQRHAALMDELRSNGKV